ncbi:cobalt-precorrin-5B (C(1))-methyltransferase CbiD [Anaerotruncus sp.]|jgi:cobalt-precorrin-5B (C1)-methyltransferase|uniref:cobalt-precorrin-5B (C(1))-methyltransferase CbiD n=1 Tax=Anaerotruncus TaxID=244127 RepID=UPI002172E7C9|nr:MULTISPECIES: cobalt-precorrin-5B (C(1))-methyltransferase CbiD [Anaerotruncus]MCI8491864.1 cobalamin biosynthesis protein CbiD [Anaerotruncus sp.]
MALERYVISGAKELRCGFTTGACAAAAAKAATAMLLSGKAVEQVAITTPNGIRLLLEVEDASYGDGFARCAVRKDAGDDADVTDGALIYASVRLTDKPEIVIEGGAGVGRVICAGLDQPVGAAAINRVPRLMIARCAREALADGGRSGRAGAYIEITVPDGEAIAQRTFNPRLGIVGGISILGTTGIVEPMSTAALIDTIRVEMKVRRGQHAGPLLVTPGNYGEMFAGQALHLPGPAVLCSNYIGEAVDCAVRLGFEGLLLVGHIGKLVKLAGGIFDTHSRTADARMEILTAHAALAGASRSVCTNLMRCVTTDAAVDLLEEAGVFDAVIKSVTAQAGIHLSRRAGTLPAELVIFSNARGVLGMTNGAHSMMERMRWNMEEQP